MPAAAKSSKPTVKAEAAKLIRSLPDDVSWDDVLYQLFVRQKIEKGLADAKSGRVHSHSSIKQEFGVAS